jgi:FAD synthase
LYDEYVEVEFVARIRDEQAFANADALVEQIQRDIAKAKTVFLALQ